MEIKIDTKKDSSKEIQHMIDFLTRFIAAQEHGDTLAERSYDASAQEGLFGLFDDSQQERSGDEQESDEQEAQREHRFSIEPY